MYHSTLGRNALTEIVSCGPYGNSPALVDRALDRESSLPEGVHPAGADHEVATHRRSSEVDWLVQMGVNDGFLFFWIMGAFDDGEITQGIAVCAGVFQRSVKKNTERDPKLI